MKIISFKKKTVMKFTCTLFIFCAASITIAQTFPIGSRTITFNDPSRTGGFGSGGGAGRQIQTEIYYPATSAGSNTNVANGKFPVVVFGHGFAMTWDAYKPVYDSLARIGYVVALPRTEGSIIPAPSHLDFGKDLALVLNKILAFDTVPSSPFFGKLNGKGAIGGHSMGGGATFLAAPYTNKANCYFTFAAAETNPKASTAAKSATQPHLLLGGTYDCVAPINSNQQLMYDSLGSNCKTLVSITRAYHCQFNADNFNCTFGEGTCFTSGGMTRDSQLLMVRFYLHPFLNYYLKGDCNEGVKLKDRLANPHKASVQQNCVLNIPLPASVSGDSEFCNGALAILEALPTGFNYLWNNGLNTQQIQVSSAGNYSAKINNGVCETETNAFVVTEKFPPTKPSIVALPNSLCSNLDSVVIEASSVPNSNGYFWDYPASWNILRNDSTNTISTQPIDGGKVTVRAFNECGLSDEDTLQVSIIPSPSFSGSLNGATSVCTNNLMQLYSINGGFNNTDSIAWSANSWQLVSGQGNLQAVFEANAPSDTIEVTGFNACNQTFTVSLAVELKDTSAVFISDSGGLLLTSGSFTTYQWYKNDSAILGATQATYSPVDSGNYYVVATNANGCSSVSNTIRYEITLSGIEPIDGKQNFFVYPNPAQSEITVESSSKAQVLILDINGKLIFNTDIVNKKSINISDYAKGIYIVVAKTNVGSVIEKLIVK